MNNFNSEYSKFYSRGVRAMYFDETQKELKKLKDLESKEVIKKSKPTLKLRKGKALATAFAISAAGWIGYGQVKEYRYQKAIDKYNESVLMLYPSEDLNMSKQDREDSAKYINAVFASKNEKLSEQEKEKYEDIIDSFVLSGKAVELEKNILTRKLDVAKKISDYKAIDKKYDSKETKLTFYNEAGDPAGFHISGVDGESYPIEGWHIISNDVPKNLINSAKDCIKYENVDWSTYDRDERVEVGIKIGEHTETILSENYIINKKGIKRINREDYEELYEDYKVEEAKKAKEKEELLKKLSREREL